MTTAGLAVTNVAFHTQDRVSEGSKAPMVSIYTMKEVIALIGPVLNGNATASSGDSYTNVTMLSGKSVGGGIGEWISLT